jgi:DNA-binding transcriptional regulator YiaG
MTRKEICDIRAATRLTQVQFAKQFGLHLRTLQGWESGDREPDHACRNLLRAIGRNPEMAAVFLAPVVATPAPAST